MIIGSGLLARSFAAAFEARSDVCIFAAGVSNSGCKDESEFQREQVRLSRAIETLDRDVLLVYFGTCSVGDPERSGTPYVQHKLAMEAMAKGQPRHLVLRLPQVAGRTPNPHTLLNFLHARISRSESFDLWMNASRNIIDVDDVVTIALKLMADGVCNDTVDIANPSSYAMTEIVDVMARVLEKRAVFKPLAFGGCYDIPASHEGRLSSLRNDIFRPGYLESVITKYYALR